MIVSTPRTPQELHRLLVIWMVASAALIGMLAGGTAYWLEAKRVESFALEQAVNSVRHLESRASILVSGYPDDHGELSQLVGQNGIIGIRVFDTGRKPIYETWGDASPSLQLKVWSHQHDWPAIGEHHRKWSDVGDERMIQVVLPLSVQSKSLIGYIETITRLDGETRHAQDDQIRRSALTASASVFLAAVLLYPLMLGMLRRSEGLTLHLLDSNLSLMRSLGNAVAKRDSDTDAHNYRVTIYAISLAEELGFSREEIADLVIGAFLHDVGKIGISDSILLKPGKLTAEEFEIMKTHVLLGTEIVGDNRWLKGAVCTIRHHHERFDGRGYPDGLVGEGIPRNARVFAIADVFDALTSERPYKRPMTADEALLILKNEAGNHFDPMMVEVFSRIAPAIFEKLGKADGELLKANMRAMVERYFDTSVIMEA